MKERKAFRKRTCRTHEHCSLRAINQCVSLRSCVSYLSPTLSWSHRRPPGSNLLSLSLPGTSRPPVRDLWPLVLSAKQRVSGINVSSHTSPFQGFIPHRSDEDCEDLYMFHNILHIIIFICVWWYTDKGWGGFIVPRRTWFNVRCSIRRKRA